MHAPARDEVRLVLQVEPIEQWVPGWVRVDLVTGAANVAIDEVSVDVQPLAAEAVLGTEDRASRELPMLGEKDRGLLGSGNGSSSCWLEVRDPSVLGVPGRYRARAFGWRVSPARPFPKREAVRSEWVEFVVTAAPANARVRGNATVWEDYSRTLAVSARVDQIARLLAGDHVWASPAMATLLTSLEAGGLRWDLPALRDLPLTPRARARCSWIECQLDVQRSRVASGDRTRDLARIDALRALLAEPGLDRVTRVHVAALQWLLLRERGDARAAAEFAVKELRSPLAIEVLSSCPVVTAALAER